MSAYRFCRTDDMPLLVEAYNRCWLPHFPEDPALTVEDFKRDVREVQLWCSSSMVAFDGDTPIGFLFGAKRAHATLVQRIAVHPDHLRRGHGRHLLTSLSSKLSILGPPTILAEVPERLAAVCALFDACGFQQDAPLTDHELPASGRGPGGSGVLPDDTFLFPVSVDDLTANELLAADADLPWQRSPETLVARKDELGGFALAGLDRIQAFLLHLGTDIVSLRVLDDEEPEVSAGSLVDVLMRRKRGQPLRFPRVAASEPAAAWLPGLGFVPGERTRRYRTTAKAA